MSTTPNPPATTPRPAAGVRVRLRRLDGVSKTLATATAVALEEHSARLDVRHVVLAPASAAEAVAQLGASAWTQRGFMR